MLPINKKEEIIFGLMNVFGMASVMIVYNMVLNGVFNKITLGLFIIQYVITFIVAFVAESIVTKRAVDLALSLPYDKKSNIKRTIAIASCIVPSMVLIMSAYGVILSILTSEIEGSLFLLYVKTVAFNFIVAYPLQLLIVGPTTRWLLKNHIRPKIKQ